MFLGSMLETLALRGGLEASSREGRERLGVLEGWVSIVINLVVSTVKLVPGLLIGSTSLVADAVHSLGDVASSVVVIWSFKAGAKPPDREHPFGHGRLESVASLVIAVLLLVAALEFGKSGVVRLLNPQPVEASLPVLVVLGSTIVLKEWLARFASRLGRLLDSAALEGDAWHHRSDALSTGVVLLALVGERMGWRYLDGAATLVVAGFIAWAGIELVRQSLDPLIGAAPPGELRDTIRRLALGVEGVQAVHDVMVHAYGTLLVISLHVEVPVELDSVRSHEVAEEVERRLAEALGAVVVVHADPVDRNHPLYRPISRLLDDLVEEMPGFLEYHDLRIVGSSERCNVVFDVVLEDMDPGEFRERVSRTLQERFPQVAAVVVEVEATLVY